MGANLDYNNEIFTQTNVDYVDYRSKNICNFKCRSCEPFYSNGIAQEVRRNDVLLKFFDPPVEKVAETQDHDYDWLIDNIQNIRRLMFTGGEPTKIAEVKNIIDIIRQRDIKDINILITTNASFTDPYWFEITKQMPNIHWTLSLDAVGQAAEIIRHGTDWPVVARNIETMFDISPSVNIGTVITNLNVLQLGTLFQWANDLRDRYAHRPNGRTQLIELCTWPRHLSPYNFPNELKPKILNYLDRVLELDLQERQRQAVEALIHGIKENKFIAQDWEKNQLYNSTLNDIRQQNHALLYEPDF